jgi:hypothetical protein
MTWILSLEIIGNSNLTIIGVYKSPSEKTEMFIDLLNEHFEKYIKLENEIICIGDMNINVAYKTPQTVKYECAIKALGLKQIMKDYTREDKNGRAKTIIDHILTNCNGVKYLINKGTDISDHHMIEVFLNKRNYTKRLKPKSFKCIANFTKVKFLEELNKFDLNENSNIDEFLEAVTESTNKFVVVKEIRESIRKWYTNELYELKKKKSQCFTEYSRSNSETDYDLFIEASNNYKKELRNAEQKYIQKQLEENRNDPTKLWKILKNLYKDENDLIERINFNGKIITNHEEIANTLNKFFIDSIQELVDNVPNPKGDNYLDNISIPNSKFKIEEISMENLIEIVKSLRKKSFADLINGRIYNEICQDDKFAKIMLSCINKSLRDGYIPKSLKNSVISPIPKVKNSDKLEDQRPVNNLPVLDKILETIVLRQLQNFLHHEKVLSNEQFGFRAKHSCETAIQTLLNQWYCHIKNKKVVITAFLDFKRAFETIDRRILIKKLEKLKFDDNAIKWLLSFLSGRTQKTKIGNKFSSDINIDIGVPQGSKLANILFLIYINDIVSLDDEANFVLYADDTSVTVVAENVLDAIIKMNQVLTKIEDWLYFNKIAINVKKCKAMILDYNVKEESKEKVLMCNQELEKVSEIKYLGVKIDSKLNFNNHADEVIVKLNKKLGFLRRNQFKMNFRSKMIFYKSLVLPHFDNCSSVLLLPNGGKINQMELIQKRILRIVTSVDDPIEEIYKKYSLVSVKNRIRINVLKLISKIRTSKLPDYLTTRFISNHESGKRDLRFADNIIINTYDKLANKSIFVYGIKDYNGYLNYSKSFDKNLCIINKIKLYVKNVICN